jgi:hypothetical protein
MLKRLTDDALFECIDVGDDVGQLRHGYQLARTMPVLQYPQRFFA